MNMCRNIEKFVNEYMDIAILTFDAFSLELNFYCKDNKMMVSIYMKEAYTGDTYKTKRYNPLYCSWKPDKIDTDWLLDYTEENKEKIIKEVIKNVDFETSVTRG